MKNYILTTLIAVYHTIEKINMQFDSADNIKINYHTVIFQTNQLIRRCWWKGCIIVAVNYPTAHKSEI